MSRSPARTASKTSTWIVVAAVGVVVLGALAVVLASRSTPSSPATVEFSEVTTTGSALPALPADGTVDPAVGANLPTISGTSFDGSPVTIDPNDGMAKLIVLVAHWCPHCQREIPALSQFYADNQLPPGSEMYIVSTKADRGAPNWPASAWLEEYPIRGATVMADSQGGEAAASLGLAGFPMFLIVDGAGRVVYRFAGEAAPSQVNELLAAVAAGEVKTPSSVPSGPASSTS